MTSNAFAGIFNDRGVSERTRPSGYNEKRFHDFATSIQCPVSIKIEEYGRFHPRKTKMTTKNPTIWRCLLEMVIFQLAMLVFVFFWGGGLAQTCNPRVKALTHGGSSSSVADGRLSRY